MSATAIPMPMPTPMTIGVLLADVSGPVGVGVTAAEDGFVGDNWEVEDVLSRKLDLVIRFVGSVA